MSKRSTASSGQLAFDAFAKGSVVHLDGGQRLRLDDKVDFWPVSGAWKSLVSQDTGHGTTTMLAFLMSQRQIEGEFPQPIVGKSSRRVTCNHCGQPAGLYRADVVYPGRDDLADRHCWVCWPCNAWVGCHQRGDGTAPLGLLADQVTRDARRAAHAAFDPIWQQGEMGRQEAYGWLSHATGIPPEKCHIGWMDQQQCQRVVDVVAARSNGWEGGTLEVGASRRIQASNTDDDLMGSDGGR